jgi:hypothetical protein
MGELPWMTSVSGDFYLIRLELHKKNQQQLRYQGICVDIEHRENTCAGQ